MQDGVTVYRLTIVPLKRWKSSNFWNNLNKSKFIHEEIKSRLNQAKLAIIWCRLNQAKLAIIWCRLSAFQVAVQKF